MNIEFSLTWHEPGKPLRRSFKLPGALDLFQEYCDRISKFAPAGTGALPTVETLRKAGGKIWICHTSRESKMLSSEKVAEHLNHLRNSGIRKLYIFIGGADGFNAEQIKKWNPDLLWNFGPAVLPHEVAAVIASEQIYRAWTIIHGLPYHMGH